MQERWLLRFGFGLFAALILLPATSSAQGPEPSPPDYVIIKLATGPRESLRKDGKPPTLEEEGFRKVPVPAGKSKAAFLEELRKLPLVESAEADGLVTAAEIPNDPYYASGPVTQAQYLSQVGAPEA